MMRRLVVLGGLLGLGVGGAGAAEPEAGRWLLDHGRTLGLNTPNPTQADAERVLVWMEAAARVNPDLAAAYLWQYDLLGRLGRTEAAMAALGSYCKLNPADVSAQLDLLDWRFQQGQTVEDRLAFCEKSLQATGLSALVQSDLHRRLAELHLRGGDRAKARAAAEQAVLDFGGNVAAHGMLVELADSYERPLREVRMSLATLAVSPDDLGELWSLARRLDGLSLHAEAARWYELGRKAFERDSNGGRVPGEFLVDFAGCCADDGSYERALLLAAEALDCNSNALEPRMLIVDVARKVGRGELVERHLAVARERVKDLTPASLEAADVMRAYLAAWYYLRYEPDPARALAFAKRASELAPEKVEARVVYGLALLASGDFEEAVAALRPHALDNQWAAAGLGEALLEQGKAEEGIAALRTGETLRSSGRAHERIVATLRARQQEPSSPPARAEVVAALRAFDMRALDFPDNPGAALRLEVVPSSPEWRYGDPWRAELRLTNTAGYAVSVGAGRMTGAQVLLSVRWGDGLEDQAVNYLPLSLALTPVLAPGESVTLAETLDVGPLAALARLAPQRDVVLNFSALLEPVMERAGAWRSGLHGFGPVAARVRRVPADVSRVGLDGLARAMEQGGEADRMRAWRTAIALLAEHQAARREKLAYHARRVDEIRLQRWVLVAVTDSIPLVRAAALDALREVRLSGRMLESVAPSLSDSSWLVRMVAVDMLCETQGASFRPVVERMATSDPDELVRRVAKQNLARMAGGER